MNPGGKGRGGPLLRVTCLQLHPAASAGCESKFTATVFVIFHGLSLLLGEVLSPERLGAMSTAVQPESSKSSLEQPCSAHQAGFSTPASISTPSVASTDISKRLKDHLDIVVAVSTVLGSFFAVFLFLRSEIQEYKDSIKELGLQVEEIRIQQEADNDKIYDLKAKMSKEVNQNDRVQFERNCIAMGREYDSSRGTCLSPGSLEERFQEITFDDHIWPR